jgi:hypothetical protein
MRSTRSTRAIEAARRRARPRRHRNQSSPRFSSNDGGLCNDVLEAHETNWGCEANNGWQAGRYGGR